ncbi:hypothetical protein BDV93DRAFT_542335 [Ceratobasidium sp. AG-I]|nr:hypothetical protein BDV93DRAFT_542335 [Ceratobasidium sp. AG-I]
MFIIIPLSTYISALINDPTLQGADAQDKPLTQHSYQANPLDSCRVQFITLTTEASSQMLKLTTNVQCPGQTRVFAVTFTRSEETGSRADSILEYLAFQITGLPNGTDRASTISSYGPPNNTFLNVLGLLDGLGRDVLQSVRIERDLQVLYMQGNFDSIGDRSVIVWDSTEDDRTMFNKTRIIYQSSSAANGALQTLTNNTLDLRYSYSSLTNMLVALRDAIHLDLGYVAPTNIYLNRTAFEYAIKPDDRIQAMWSVLLDSRMSSGQEDNCSWAWGCLSALNTTWAWGLTSSSSPFNNLSLPISPKSLIYPSVININYLCP